MNDNSSKLEKYADIQAMVQKEIQTQFPKLYAEYATKYGVSETPLHTHNGVDSNRISQSNITPNTRASGNITMATDGARYSLGSTFNPTSVLFYGSVVHRTGGTVDKRAHVIGNAQIGPSYYLQPDTSTSVKTGGPLQNVIQSSAYIFINSAGGGGSSVIGLTGAPAMGATGATLSAVWPGATGFFIIGFGSGEVRNGFFINGSTTLTWNNAPLTVAGGTNQIEVQTGGAGTIVRAGSGEEHIISVTDDTSTIVARATIPSDVLLSPNAAKGYGQGVIFVDVELASGWEIDGNFVMT